MAPNNPFQAEATLTSSGKTYSYFRLAALEEQGLGKIARLPYSIRVLLESALRNTDGYLVLEADVRAILGWQAKATDRAEIPFLPGRVVLQDFTGVPCVVDLAAMRAAMQRLGGEPKKINPLVPCDLVIDHSVQVDYFGTASALEQNIAREFERNRERYEFLKWGQQSLANFRAVPPATGIVHQVNLEYLARVTLTRDVAGRTVAFPDSLVGTDSHTTMINGLGVLGWGVGGIEAEAVMLGQPIYMLLPDVVGVQLEGRLREGVTATDLVLTVTQLLRKRGVVEKFVEFFGEGARGMSLADRATIANMAPEYGATMGFFPVDEETLRYLRQTGRDEALVQLVRDYYTAQGMFATASSPVPEFSDTLTLDLATVEPSLAGPKRPQDRVTLAAMAQDFRAHLTKPIKERGFQLAEPALAKRARVQGIDADLGHGAVVIAAITSCTNTSNPSVLVAAGLLAQKAVARGLTTRPWVKTSLAPGSRVVTDYLQRAGLDKALDALGFQTVGYGCTTCIGNSGPLPEAVAAAVRKGELVAAAVLSGNRNFEGRVNPDVKANYLASPPLVVAYALAGSVDKDLLREPIGKGRDGKDVFLKEIWPSQQEIADTIRRCMDPEMFRAQYAKAAQGPAAWQAIATSKGDLYAWKRESTYIQEPPYFRTLAKSQGRIEGIRGARVLAMLGDSVTTDHISPAGDIEEKSPAGQYLLSLGVPKAEFNSYGARRGNDRVMTRGTFANIRLRNLLAPGTEGGVTVHLPSGEVMSIYDAAQRYREAGTPLCVLAGKEYGTGSSRDWAAKGTNLLGVKFVLAESYERIHRSNLVGMGVLPLQFLSGQNRETLGLTGKETFALALGDDLKPRSTLQLEVDGRKLDVLCRIDTPVEIDYYRNGGILQTVLKKLL